MGLCLFGMSACATNAVSPQWERVARTACDAPEVRELIGQQATSDLATQAMRLTGATIFEWIEPDMIVTASYSPYRIRVTHDRALRVVAISCG